VKILEPGRQQKGWSTEAKCTGKGNGNGGCGAKLLVEQPDLFRTSSSAMGETDYYVTFECAACGVLTDLENVPGSVESKLPWRKDWAEAHPAPTRKP
jgi:hypothetical protein